VASVKTVSSVNIDKLYGFDNLASLVKSISNPKFNIHTSYLLLDTRYRLLENDGTKYFKWNNINDLLVRQGTVNTVDTVIGLISMKLRPFRMHLTANGTTPYKLTSITIEELSTQAVIAHEERRYHFIGETDVIVPYADPLAGIAKITFDNVNNGEFKFTKPITYLDTITIKLASPLEPITFHTDRLAGIIGNINVTYIALLVIDFDIYPNLDNTDFVYISGFTTINPSVDIDFITFVNSNTGKKISTSGNGIELLDIDLAPIYTNNLPGAISGVTATQIVGLLLTTNFTEIFKKGDQFMYITNNLYSPPFQIFYYTIKSVINNSVMEIEPHNNPPLLIFNFFAYRKNNLIKDQRVDVYFGPKRMFFQLEVSYLAEQRND
jgi:hypothetical protein